MIKDTADYNTYNTTNTCHITSTSTTTTTTITSTTTTNIIIIYYSYLMDTTDKLNTEVESLKNQMMAELSIIKSKVKLMGHHHHLNEP